MALAEHPALCTPSASGFRAPQRLCNAGREQGWAGDKGTARLCSTAALQRGALGGSTFLLCKKDTSPETKLSGESWGGEGQSCPSQLTPGHMAFLCCPHGSKASWSHWEPRGPAASHGSLRSNPWAALQTAASTARAACRATAGQAREPWAAARQQEEPRSCRRGKSSHMVARAALQLEVSSAQPAAPLLLSRHGLGCCSSCPVLSGHCMFSSRSCSAAPGRARHQAVQSRLKLGVTVWVWERPGAAEENTGLEETFGQSHCVWVQRCHGQH